MYSAMPSATGSWYDFPCEQVGFLIRFCDYYISSVTDLIVSQSKLKRL